MKLNGNIKFELMEVIANAILVCQPTLPREVAVKYAMAAVDSVDKHPTIKVVRQGVRLPKPQGVQT